MGRRRYISTDISTDIKLAELAEHGTLPLLLYTWAIPHMDDWGRMSGDPRQFKLMVCPAIDVTSKDIDVALSLIHDSGLWIRYEVDGKKCICIPEERWFKHQSYINKSKRGDDQGSNFPPPQIAEEQRKSPNYGEEQQELPEKAASSSFSLSPSLSLSLSPSPSNTTATTAAPARKESDSESRIEPFFAAYRRVFLRDLTPFQVQELGKYIDDEGFEESVIVRAIERSGMKSGGISLVIKILNDYAAAGAKTRDGAIAFDNEFEEKKAAAESRREQYNRPLSPRRGSGKPPMPVVENKDPPTEITPEQRERMLERARRLAGERKEGSG